MAAGLSQEDKGKMIMAGALIDPLDGGILVFKDCTKEVRARLTGRHACANSQKRAVTKVSHAGHTYRLGAAAGGRGIRQIRCIHDEQPRHGLVGTHVCVTTSFNQQPTSRCLSDSVWLPAAAGKCEHTHA